MGAAAAGVERKAGWLRSLALVVMLLAAPAFAVEPDEMLEDPVLEERARDISAGLRCLVCQNQSIDDSDAPLAADLRVLVRERIAAGDTDDEVMAFVVDRYGEFVLLKPRFSAGNLVLWATPLLVLAAGIMLLVRRRRAARSAAEERLTADEERALAKFLEDRD